MKIRMIVSKEKGKIAKLGKPAPKEEWYSSLKYLKVAKSQ